MKDGSEAIGTIKGIWKQGRKIDYILKPQGDYHRGDTIIGVQTVNAYTEPERADEIILYCGILDRRLSEEEVGSSFPKLRRIQMNDSERHGWYLLRKDELDLMPTDSEIPKKGEDLWYNINEYQSHICPYEDGAETFHSLIKRLFTTISASN